MDDRPVLYVDLGSPYAYLAVARAERVLGVAPALEPILLGALFERRGRGSWSQTPARAEGMAEVERRARAYGLAPVVWPPAWPSNGLVAMRAAVWAARRGTLDAFAREVFHRQFAQGADIADHEVLAAAAGVTVDELRAAIADPVVKQALRDATEAAWDAGVRGVPTLRAGDRLIYGDDRLEQAADTPRTGRPGHPVRGLSDTPRTGRPGLPVR